MEERIKTMLSLLDEKKRRIFLESEAISYGWGNLGGKQDKRGFDSHDPSGYQGDHFRFGECI